MSDHLRRTRKGVAFGAWLVLALAGCDNGADGDAEPPEPDAVAVSQGIEAEVGPARIGVATVQDERAGLSVFVPASGQERAERVTLAEGESTTVRGVSVRLVQTDTDGDHDRVWVVVSGPTPS